MRHRELLVLLGSICLALILTVLPFVGACAPAAPPEEEAPPPEEEAPPPAPVKDTLVIGIPELPPTIDPETSQLIGAYITLACSDRMLRFGVKPSPGTEGVSILDYDAPFIPALAESYEISPDSTEITFHLRKGAKSPSGSEFTAEDLAWNMERATAMKGLIGWLRGVMGVPEDGYEIINDYTVKATASKPNPLLAAIHANSCYVFLESSEAKEHATADDPWATNFVKFNLPSPGPYYVTSWEAGKEAVLKANPNYWGGEPEIKKIIWKVIHESSSRLAMIRDGTIDIAYMLSPKEIDSLRGVPGVKVVVEKGLDQLFLSMNPSMVEPFKNKLVRQAINYAIDRERINDIVYYGMAEPAWFILPSQFPGVLPAEEWPYKNDLEKAKELMVEAGYSDGFEVELSYKAGITKDESTAILIKEDLAKIGIDVTLKKTPIGALVTMAFAHEIPFMLYAESPWQPSVNYAVDLFFTSWGFCNYGSLSDPMIDEMTEEGKSIFVKEAMFEHHYELQRRVIDQAPWAFILQEPYTVAIRDNVEGYNLDVGNLPRFEEFSFAK